MGRPRPQGRDDDVGEHCAVGVTLPRGCTGRIQPPMMMGAGRGQCYRFPDLYAAEGSAEWQLLQALRPVQTHPRLVIVPPGRRRMALRRRS